MERLYALWKAEKFLGVSTSMRAVQRWGKMEKSGVNHGVRTIGDCRRIPEK